MTDSSELVLGSLEIRTNSYLPKNCMALFQNKELVGLFFSRDGGFHWHPVIPHAEPIGTMMAVRPEVWEDLKKNVRGIIGFTEAPPGDTGGG